MTDDSLSSPLLQPQPSDHPPVILSIRDNHNHYYHRHNSNSSSHNLRNPFEFLGSDFLSVPPPSTVDPFRNNTPKIEGVYEVLKSLICLPIALARLVLFGACLLVGYLATKLALGGWKDKNNPMPKWRSRLMWITRFSARCILFSFGYHWIKRKGNPAPREIAPIVVSNHVSYIEPIFYFYELFPTIVAAESHDSIPFVGTIIRAMQVIYVNRFSQSSRKLAVNEIKRKASCDRFPRVLLFPEGTTTNGNVVISFQLGAFIPGYAIQPVIVRYPHVHFDQSWGYISLAKLMFRMFTQFHNFMEVEYLPIVSPLDNCKENPVHFAKRTSHSIASALNVVQTFHSYGDLMLLMKASHSKQEKPSSYMVEMAKVESLYHISSLEAVDFLDKFLSMNPDPSGRVKFHDFLRAMRLRTCSLLEEIFGFVDVEKIGSITFKQFLYGSAHVMKQPLFRQTCELACTRCSGGEDNLISKEQLGDTIRLAIPDLDDAEIHELFKLFGGNDDGRASKETFMCCLKKNPLLIALFWPCLVYKDSLECGGRMLEELV
ncbi:lysophospholipid acyltransferase LPEAT2 isoform X1 [Ricinus communis]|uniref:lysophospholipid acyltransferase LPEAT2 isoform X1 n=1 Tax=Ricinus communis TaxID=3988 RepID=UPI00201A628F|nr:lysophospholipid acyltransferase LPEAT2 isoform X1 [Ricinus communis]